MFRSLIRILAVCEFNANGYGNGQETRQTTTTSGMRKFAFGRYAWYDLDRWPRRSWRLLLMRVVVLHPYTKFEVRNNFVGFAVRMIWRTMCVSINGLVTLNFDLLTLKPVCESHQRWRTFLPSLGTLCLRVLELLAMYATDGQTKPTLTAPFPTGGGIISENVFNIMTQHDDVVFSTDIYNQNLSNQ